MCDAEDKQESLSWLQSVYDYGKSTHNEALFRYFRGETKQDDLTLAVVNLVGASCKAVFGTSSSKAADSQLDPAACAAYLYYMVSESLLQQLFPRDAQEAAAASAAAGQTQRFKGMVKARNPPACRQLVSCQEFHMPLIECALQLVHFITTPQATTEQLHVSEVLQRQDRAALMWQAARSFSECFGPSSPLPMPAPLQAYLQQLQDQLLDALVFQSGSVTYELLTAGGGCQYQPGDMTLARDIISAYASKAVQQAQEVAWDVQQQQPAGAGISADFHEQCAWLMDHVLLQHLELCFGVHMAVVVACVIYVTAKVQQATLPFSTITQVLTSKAIYPSSLFSHTEIAAQPLQHGDLRAYYNNRFLTAVQGDVRSYLQQYDEWCAQERAHKLPQSPASQPMASMPTMNAREHHSICAAGGHPPQRACQASPQQTSQAQPGTRVPFGTLHAAAALITTTNKVDTNQHPHQQLRPSSQHPAACDKENLGAGIQAPPSFNHHLQVLPRKGLAPMR